MLPYRVFAEILKSDPSRSFRDMWFDFEVWEQSRGFRDDPSAASKQALDWVRNLAELDEALNEFEGPGIEQCHQSIENVFAAFARLEHSTELCEAIVRWKKWKSEDA